MYIVTADMVSGSYCFTELDTLEDAKQTADKWIIDGFANGNPKNAIIIDSVEIIID